MLENFYESYLNLTIKTLLMVKFVAHLAKKPEYIFKVSFHFQRLVGSVVEQQLRVPMIYFKAFMGSISDIEFNV